MNLLSGMCMLLCAYPFQLLFQWQSYCHPSPVSTATLSHWSQDLWALTSPTGSSKTMHRMGPTHTTQFTRLIRDSVIKLTLVVCTLALHLRKTRSRLHCWRMRECYIVHYYTYCITIASQNCKYICPGVRIRENVEGRLSYELHKIMYVVYIYSMRESAKPILQICIAWICIQDCMLLLNSNKFYM